MGVLCLVTWCACAKCTVEEAKSPVKNLVHIYIYDVKFLALLGAPYIYDISRLRVKLDYDNSYSDDSTNETSMDQDRSAATL
jgi:hypothetical protein